MVSEIAISLALITLCAIGLLYFWSYQRWMRKRADYELARRLLRSIYNVREAVRAMRNPFGNGGDHQARWGSVHDALVVLDVEAFEAEAVWGHEIRELLTPLRKHVADLFAHVELYLRQLQNPERRILDEKTSERLDEIMYDLDDLAGKPSENVFTRGMAEAIAQLEQFLKPHLRF